MPCLITCSPTISCRRWALPCSSPGTPRCPLSERRLSLLTRERHSSERKASPHYCASSVALVCFKAKKNTQESGHWFLFFFTCADGGLCREAAWAAGGMGAPLGWGSRGGVKGRWVQPPSYQGRASKTWTWQHAWGTEEKHDFTQPKLNWKFVGPSDWTHK